MSAMPTERSPIKPAPSPAAAVPRRNPRFINGDSPAISVVVQEIGPGADPDRPFRLEFPEGALYTMFQFNFAGVIRWNLSTTADVTVRFDNPAITFLTSPGAADAYCPDAVTLEVPWTNLIEHRPNGLSFYYTLHVVVTLPDGMEIPVSHDPTVHNEPPIP
jgi:hypothetical protein